MGTDGKFSIRRASNNDVVWASQPIIGKGGNLCLGHYCNLVLYGDGTNVKVWSLPVFKDDVDAELVLQDDGNLVLKSIARVGQSSTSDENDYENRWEARERMMEARRREMMHDRRDHGSYKDHGNLRGNSQGSQHLWASGTCFPASVHDIDKLEVGQLLALDQSLKYGDASASFGRNGTFTLRNGNKTTICHDFFTFTPDSTNDPVFLRVNEGGTLSIIDTEGKERWCCSQNSAFVSQQRREDDDRRQRRNGRDLSPWTLRLREVRATGGAALIVASPSLDPVWSTEACRAGPTPMDCMNMGFKLYPNDTLIKTQALVSISGRYKCFIDDAGALTIAVRDEGSIREVAFRDPDLKAESLELQPNGELVLKKGANKVWSSGTIVPYEVREVVLKMQDDANLVLYADGKPIWESGKDWWRENDQRR